MTLTSILSACNIKDLKRALNSDKEYLFFKVSVFNAGVSVQVKCTDIFKSINGNTWNGYDCIFENDKTTKFYIKQAIKDKLN